MQVETPAGRALERVFTLFSAVLRLTCGLAGAPAALAVRTPPVDTALLITVVTLVTGWSVLFAVLLLRGVGRSGLMAIDLALTIGVCLLIRRLVAPEVLPGEVSWVAILASTSVIVAQLILPAGGSVPAGLLVAGAYGYGAHLAGADAEAVDHASTLLLQTACAAALAAVTRRSSRHADAAFTSYQQAVRAALTARAARAAERQQNRDLHDTALATLTMVGLGGVTGQSALLRERAAADLRTLAALSDTEPGAGSTAGTQLDDPDPAVVPGKGGGTHRDPAGVALDTRLRELLGRLPQLRVDARLAPCVVPPSVAEAVTHSAAELLSNVLRHAPDATAELRLTERDGTVLVEVTDDGPGFDPTRVPRHRYGLRESVHGRMAEVGGWARVESVPGRGTRVRLEWPGVH